MSEFHIDVETRDENTLLLIHGGAVEDASGFEQEIANFGVTISSEQSKFGNGSMYFDGSGSRLQIPNLIQGNTPFTVECWVMPLSVKNNTIWSHGGTNTPTGTGGGVEAYGAGTFIYYCNGFLIQGGSYQTNQWHHIALVGEQNTIKLYVNGSLIGQTDGAYNFADYVEDIGANASVYGGENFHGYIDEVRISNVARWTSDFTPPTERYTAKSTTKKAVTGLAIPDGVVTQITDAAGRVLWSASPYFPVFENNTWEQIIQACQNNEVPDTWAVGGQKAMIVDGQSYLIDIIGKNHDIYSDGSGTAPLTFQFHEVVYDLCYDYMMPTGNTDGGYDASLAHTTGLPVVLGAMPSVVQSAIKSVDKKSSVGNKDTTIETVSCKLFLLSEVEIFGSVTNSAAGEGTQYKYYSDGNSAIRCKRNTTYKQEYWTRSPYITGGYAWCVVTKSGTAGISNVRNQRNVAPAFCF